MVDPKEEKCANFEVSSLPPYKMEWAKNVMSKKWNDHKMEWAVNGISKEYGISRKWQKQKIVGWARNWTCRKNNEEK